MIDAVVRRLARERLADLLAFAANPRAPQEKVLNGLIARAHDTAFGREHQLYRVRSHTDLARQVPLRDYAALEPWFKRAMDGENGVIWPGAIKFWAISSGTTSGEKYLPVSADTIRGNRRGAFDAVCPAIVQDNPGLFSGRLLFLGGSTRLRRHRGNWIGDNTGIMTMHIPRVMRAWHTPGQRAASASSWEEKIERTVRTSCRHDVRMISGVPSWIVLLAERMLQHTGKDSLRALWPNLKLYVHGGMSFGPYAARFHELAGPGVRTADTYSASEGGMLAVQDQRDDPGMLPLLDITTFFEFVPVEELAQAKPRRLPIWEVQTGVDYAVVLNTDSGIFSYLVGDVVRFTSTNPLRLVFAGRVRHTLNSFGEHVSGAELDRAIAAASAETGASVTEFAVATEFPAPGSPVGGHVWYVEFRTEPADTAAFAAALDRAIIAGNEDYEAHRRNDFGMKPPRVLSMPQGAFYDWMKVRGRYGGQNKVPRVLMPDMEESLRTQVAAAAR